MELFKMTIRNVVCFNKCRTGNRESGGLDKMLPFEFQISSKEQKPRGFCLYRPKFCISVYIWLNTHQMKYLSPLLSLFVLLPCSVVSQINPSGDFEITFSFPDLSGKEIYIAYPFMGKTYVSDTISLDETGRGYLKAKKEKGLYYVVYPPDNDYFQILLDNEFKFVVKADINRVPQSVNFTGSPQNTRFYTHLNKVGRIKEMADSVENLNTLTSARKTFLADSLQNRFEVVTGVFSNQYKGSLATEMVRLSQFPKFKEGKTEEENRRNFYAYRNEFQKLLVLDDPRLIRTVDFVERIHIYLDQLVEQKGDSVTAAVDYILTKAAKNKDVFKVVLVDLLNKYAVSKMVWGEDVYCRIALTYYAAGKADWIEKEQLDKIVTNAKKIEPTMHGKKATDFSFTDLSGKRSTLYGQSADYLVLFFMDEESSSKWAGEIKELIKVHNSLAGGVKRVQFITCWMSGSDAEKKKAIYEGNNLSGPMLLNVTPENLNDVKKSYYLSVYPKIFVLDRDMHIVAKRISAAGIPDVIK